MALSGLTMTWRHTSDGIGGARRRKAARMITFGALAGALLIGAATLWPAPGEAPAVTESPSSTTTSPSTSTPTPAEASGAFETPLGRIEWRHLTGDRDSMPLPQFEELLPTPTGFSALDAEGRLWRSTEGYEWASSQLPVTPQPLEAHLGEAGGALWLVASQPKSIWRSDDGDTWTSVEPPPGAGTMNLYDENGTVWLISSDPPGAWFLEETKWVDGGTGGFAPPDVTGIRWTLEPGFEPARPVSVGGATVIPWFLGGRADWDTMLGLDPETNSYGNWDTATETMEIFGISSNHPVTTLGFEQAGNRFTVTDLASGEVVHEIVVNDPRIDLASYPESLIGALGYMDKTLAVVDAVGTITRVTPPWGGLDGSHPPTLLGGDQLVALTQTTEPPLRLEAWTSPDGVNWSGPTQPNIDLGDEANQFLHVRVEGEVMLAEAGGPDGLASIWVSTDGVSWSDTGVSGVVPDMNFYRLGSGGIYFDIYSSRLYASADLLSWEPVETGDLRVNFDQLVDMGGAHGGWEAGDSLFIIGSSNGGQREMWVLRLQG